MPKRLFCLTDITARPHLEHCCTFIFIILLAVIRSLFQCDHVVIAKKWKKWLVD
jgi:hypothetical protein